MQNQRSRAIKRRLGRFLLAVIVGWMLAASPGVGVVAGELDGKLEGRLRQQFDREILPAAYRGDSLEVLKSLAAVVSRADDAQIPALDALLAEQKLPPTGNYLAELRLRLTMQGLGSALPRPQPRELVYVIPATRGEIERILDRRQDQIIGKGKLPDPASIQEYDEIFWKIHVYTNELVAAARLAEYGQALLDTARNQVLRKLTAEEKSAIDVDFAALAYEGQQTARELEEVKVELRLRRLARAAQILQTSTDFQERLAAAFAADTDAELLNRFFESNSDVEFGRPKLNAEGVTESVQTYGRAIQQASGKLVEKSHLLFEGLHWWLRGRYGMGPDGYGLLKSPLAMQSPATLFPLFMPIETPSPADPFGGTSAAEAAVPQPRFDRRHHYNWMYEYRQLTVGNEYLTRKTDTEKIVLPHFY